MALTNFSKYHEDKTILKWSILVKSIQHYTLNICQILESITRLIEIINDRDLYLYDCEDFLFDRYNATKYS